MKKSSISVKITFLVITIQILVILFFIIGFMGKVTQSMEESVLNSMDILVYENANLTNSYIEKCTSFLDGFSSNAIVAKACENSRTSKYIEEAQTFTEKYAHTASNLEGLYIALPDSFVLTHTNPASRNQTFRDADSMLELSELLDAHSNAFCTGIVTAPVTKKQVIPIYKGIYDNSGQMIGFVGAAFYTDELEEKLNQSNSKSNAGTEHFLINTQTNVIIFNENINLVGTTNQDSGITNLLLQIEEAPTDDFFRATNGNRIYSGYYISDRSWLFVESNTRENIMAPITNTQNIMYSIIFLFVVFITLISSIVISKMLKPLTEIEKSVDKLYQNDSQKNLSLDQYIKRKDEFGSFAKTINMLQEALENQNNVCSELLKIQNVGFISIEYDTDRIVLINREALALLGVKDTNVKIEYLHELYELILPENVGKLKETITQLKESNSEISVEYYTHNNELRCTCAIPHGKYVNLTTGNKVITFSLVDITDS